jgi:N-acetyl-anhydromuramyl-L-alanine amidase AmpD
VSAPILRLWQSGNFWPGRPAGPPIALVLHTEAGSEGGTEAIFTNNASQVSAHFGVALNGASDQFVNLPDRAWANGIREPGNAWDFWKLPDLNPNELSVSIETEDGYSPGVRGPQPVTEAQFASVLRIGLYVLQVYPRIRWLLRHADISPHSRAACCGPRWVDSGLFSDLADRLGLITLGS